MVNWKLKSIAALPALEGFGAMSESVRIRVPATTANLDPGFDSLESVTTTKTPDDD